MSVNPILPASVSVVCSSNPACVGIPVTYTADAVNGGVSPAYQWLLNGANTGPNLPVFEYAPADGDIIACKMTSGELCVSGNPAYSNGINMIIGSSFAPIVTIVASGNPICALTPVTFTVTSTFGGPSPSYQWYVNGNHVGTSSTTYSYFPLDGDAVQCLMNSQLSCATVNPSPSNVITMTVLAIPVNVTITESPTGPVCAGTFVTFTSWPSNGGSNPTFQWKVNGLPAGTNSITFSYPPADGDVVTCTLMSNATCSSANTVTSLPIFAEVNPNMPVSVSVTSSPGSTVCYGTAVTYTATTINRGSAPLFQWKVNGGAVGLNGPVFTCTPVNGDIVTCTLTSDVVCAAGSPYTSAPITMTVNPNLPVSVSIAPSVNPVCAGIPISITATTINGGTVPLYQWKVNGTNAGTGTSIFTCLPADNDLITCELTSNATCATGNPSTSGILTMTVNPVLAAAISVAPSSNPVCAGNSVSFTATVANGGAAPVYQWKVNGTNAGTGNPVYIYLPANNDVITCELTSDAICSTGSPATSAPVTMTVNPVLPVAISIASSSNPLCAGTSVTFTSTIINGGTAPSYQWKVNGIDAGTAGSVYNYVPSNNDAITCQLTSNAMCASGNPATSGAVTMFVNPILPVSVSISSSANPVCGGTPVLFTAIATNGGSLPAYQWKVNGTNAGTGGSGYTYVPVNDDVLTCELTSNAVCATGNPANSGSVTMTVNPVLTVSITIAPSSNPVCAGTPVTFTATSVNGGNAPSYQWKVNGADAGTGNTVFTYVPVNNDLVSCVLTSNATCALGNPSASGSVIMTVNPYLPVSISIAPVTDEVCSGTTVTFTAVPVNEGMTPAYQWQVNGVEISGATGITYSIIPVSNDVITCKLASSAACPTGNPAISTPVTMTVNPLVNVSVSVSVSATLVCGGTPVTCTAIPVNGGAVPLYQWKVNSQPVPGATNAIYSFIPVANDEITCELTADVLCPTVNPAISASLTIAVVTVPVVTYAACHDIVTAVYAKPFRLRGGLPSGGVYSGDGVNSLTGFFDPSVAGQGAHTVTYTYPPSGMCAVSKLQVINNHGEPPANCLVDPALTDLRDLRVYPIVRIGTQCWFAGNLNYGTLKIATDPQTDNCVNDKYCLNNNEANCNIFGGIYQWDELMRYDQAVEGHQGLCPPGWHVPAEAEWAELFGFYGGQAAAGELLRDKGAGSFKALMGGVLYQNQTNWSFNPPDFAATFFWSSEPTGLWQAKAHGLNNAVVSVSDYSSGRRNGFSVRCLQDQ